MADISEDAAPTPAEGASRAGETGRMAGHLLRRCQQIAVSIFLKECREYELTPLQFAVLSALENHGALEQARLAGFSALDRTTVGVVIGKLEGRGLVKRRPSDKDRRSKLISTTAAGREMVARALPAVRTAQARIMAPLSASEQARFLDYLARIADANNSESRAPLRYR